MIFSANPLLRAEKAGDGFLPPVAGHPIIICRSGKTRRGFRLTAPKRHAAMAHLNSIRGRNGPKGSSAFFGGNVAPMGPAVVVAIATENRTDTNLSAISIRCQFRSGGHARFQLLQKTLRRVANLLQPQGSFSDPASYEQETIGVFGNVRKAFGEIRNV